jgi:hypothetical protein
MDKLYSSKELMDIPLTPKETSIIKGYIDRLKNNIETDGDNFVIVENPSDRIYYYLESILGYKMIYQINSIYRMSLGFQNNKSYNPIINKKFSLAPQAPFGEEMNQGLPPTEEEKKKALQDVLDKINNNISYYEID